MTKVSSLPSMAAEDGDHVLLQTAEGVTALTPVGAGAGGSSGSDLPVVGVFVPSTMMGGQYYYTAGYNIKDKPFDDPDRFAIPQVSYSTGSSSSELSWNNLLVAHHLGYSTSNLKKDAGNSVGRRLLFTKDPAVITEYIGRASSSEFLLTPYALDEQDSHLHVFLPFALSLSFLAGSDVHDSNEGSVQLWYDMLPFDESVLDGVLVHVQIPVNATDDKDDGWPYLYENVWPVLHRLLRDERLGTCADYAYAGIGQFTHPKRTKPFADQLVGDKFESARYMFQGCDLSTAVFPNARFGNLVDARGMFVNTSGISGNLKKQFPNADFSSVERADWMFAGLDGTGFLWETDFMPNVRTASHIFEAFGPISTSGSDVRMDIFLPQTMPNLEDASYMFASLSYGKSGDWSSNSVSTHRVLSQASIDALRDANWPNLRRASYMFAGNEWDTDTRNGRLNIDLSALATVKWPKLEDIDHIFYGYMENATTGAPLLNMTKPGNLEAIKHLLSLATGRIDCLFGRRPTGWSGTLSDADIATTSKDWAYQSDSYANPFSQFKNLENVTFTNLEDLSDVDIDKSSNDQPFLAVETISNLSFPKLKRLWKFGRDGGSDGDGQGASYAYGLASIDGLHFPELLEHGFGDGEPADPWENLLGMYRATQCSTRLTTLRDLTAPKLKSARKLLMNEACLATVDGLDVHDATDISYMFALLQSTASGSGRRTVTMTLTNCDFSSAVKADHMFAHTSGSYWPGYADGRGYREIVFGDGVSFPLVEDASHMFENASMSKLPKITNELMPKVKNVSHMFAGCNNLSLGNSEPEGGPEIVLDGVEDASYMFYNLQDQGDGHSYPTAYPLKHVRLSGIVNAAYMFANSSSSSSSSSIYGTMYWDGVENIDFSTIKDANHMFHAGSRSETTLPAEFADIDLSSLENSNYMFKFNNSVNLTVLDPWAEKPWFEEVKDRGGFDGIFAGCHSGCTFPTWVTDEMKTARKS